MTSNISNLIQLRQKQWSKWLVVNITLAAFILMIAILSIMLGNTIYSFSDTFHALMGEQVQGASFAIQTIRLPRVLAAILVGLSFGISGDIFQTMLRNPLANPNVLGITSGASAFAVFCILILNANYSVTSTAAIIGGLVTVLVIYFLSNMNRFSIGKLILIGIGIQALTNALISYFILIGSEKNLNSALRWLSGSLNGVTLSQLPLILIALFILLPVMMYLSRSLSLFELGEEASIALGNNNNVTRVVLLVAAVILISLATSITGPIAFISFLAAPISKRLVGGSHSSLFTSGLIGILLVLLGDLVGQHAFGIRYPVGVITGLLGSPYLIYLLIRMNKRGEL